MLSCSLAGLSFASHFDPSIAAADRLGCISTMRRLRVAGPTEEIVSPGRRQQLRDPPRLREDGPMRAHLSQCGVRIAWLQIDPANGVRQHVDLKAPSGRVERGCPYAVVC